MAKHIGHESVKEPSVVRAPIKIQWLKSLLFSIRVWVIETVSLFSQIVYLERAGGLRTLCNFIFSILAKSGTAEI